MKKIKLMLNYECSPLWWDQEDKVGNIDPNDLPLTEETKTLLINLADRFDIESNFNHFDHDLEIGISDPIFERLNKVLEAVHKVVQKELPDYEVGLHV